jgi:hypothetical protein
MFKIYTTKLEDNSERTLDLPPVLTCKSPSYLVFLTEGGITVLEEADFADRVIVNNVFVS